MAAKGSKECLTGGDVAELGRDRSTRMGGITTSSRRRAPALQVGHARGETDAASTEPTPQAFTDDKRVGGYDAAVNALPPMGGT